MGLLDWSPSQGVQGRRTWVIIARGFKICQSEGLRHKNYVGLDLGVLIAKYENTRERHGIDKE